LKTKIFSFAIKTALAHPNAGVVPSCKVVGSGPGLLPIPCQHFERKKMSGAHIEIQGATLEEVCLKKRIFFSADLHPAFGEVKRGFVGS
jgi:hypothetical protein